MSFSKIAGSKGFTQFGLSCTLVGASLIGGATSFVEAGAFRSWVVRIGGLLSLIGGVCSALGKALGDQRSGSEETGAPEYITLPDGTRKRNERGVE